MFSRQLGFKTLRCRNGFAFSRQLLTYMTSSNAAALHTQNDRCTTSKQRESYREQTAPTDLYYNDGSACFRIALAVFWCHVLIVCALLLQVHTCRPLLELQSANFSPPPLKVCSLHNRREYASWEGLLPGSSSLVAKFIPVFVKVRSSIVQLRVPTYNHD